MSRFESAESRARTTMCFIGGSTAIKKIKETMAEDLGFKVVKKIAGQKIDMWGLARTSGYVHPINDKDATARSLVSDNWIFANHLPFTDKQGEHPAKLDLYECFDEGWLRQAHTSVFGGRGKLRRFVEPPPCQFSGLMAGTPRALAKGVPLAQMPEVKTGLNKWEAVPTPDVKGVLMFKMPRKVVEMPNPGPAPWLLDSAGQLPVGPPSLPLSRPGYLSYREEAARQSCAILVSKQATLPPRPPHTATPSPPAAAAADLLIQPSAALPLPSGRTSTTVPGGPTSISSSGQPSTVVQDGVHRDCLPRRTSKTGGDDTAKGKTEGEGIRTKRQQEPQGTAAHGKPAPKVPQKSPALKRKRAEGVEDPSDGLPRKRSERPGSSTSSGESRPPAPAPDRPVQLGKMLTLLGVRVWPSPALGQGYRSMLTMHRVPMATEDDAYYLLVDPLNVNDVGLAQTKQVQRGWGMVVSASFFKQCVLKNQLGDFSSGEHNLTGGF